MEKYLLELPTCDLILILSVSLSILLCFFVWLNHIYNKYRKKWY